MVFATIGKCFRTAIIISCSIALIFQLMNLSSCTFIFKASENTDDTLDFGLYRVGINDECLDGDYDAVHQNDKMLINARNCHTSSMVAGACAMLLVLTECLKCKIFCGKLIESIFFTIAWTNAAAVFIVFGMDGCGQYLNGEQLQEGFDNMTMVADMIENMDENPNSSFEMNDQMREQIESIDSENPFGFNATELIPDFLQAIPLGTKCHFGQGASLNVVTVIIYFACGFLLCFTPKPDPIWGSDKESDTQIDGPTTTLSGSATGDASAWTTTSEKIV